MAVNIGTVNDLALTAARSFTVPLVTKLSSHGCSQVDAAPLTTAARVQAEAAPSVAPDWTENIRVNFCPSLGIFGVHAVQFHLKICQCCKLS